MPALPIPIASFLSDPTLGLPVALVLGLLVGWLLAHLTGSASPPPTRTTWRRPDQDPVSQTFYAAEDGLHSHLVHAAYDRLDRALHASYGVGMNDLGWRPWSTPGQQVPWRRELVRLRERLSRRYTESVQHESSIRVHWAFWRDPSIDESRFVSRVSDAVHSARLMVQYLEQPR